MIRQIQQQSSKKKNSILINYCIPFIVLRSQQKMIQYLFVCLLLWQSGIYDIISISTISKTTTKIVSTVQAYPVIINIDETSERCIRFNIPDGDDAHLAAVVVPTIDELDGKEDLEDWYVVQINELCKQRGKHQILKKELPGLDTIPDSVASQKSNYLQHYHETATKLKLKITGTPVSNPKIFQHQYNTKYFDLVIVNHVGRTTDARAKKPQPGQHSYRTGSDHLEGYGICFHNQDADKAIQIIFDIVLSSEDYHSSHSTKGSNNGNGPGFDKERHLTPLEESLEQSIHSANTILREMNYLEKRENRMRKTADSINTRVRWFSYLSVSVLLSVTYIQVTYLKRYFHKKKLM